MMLVETEKELGLVKGKIREITNAREGNLFVIVEDLRILLIALDACAAWAAVEDRDELGRLTAAELVDTTRAHAAAALAHHDELAQELGHVLERQHEICADRMGAIRAWSGALTDTEVVSATD